MGLERTIEQDPTFAFRVIVDIAVKALSSAINDPTTAVLSLDQLHRLLRAGRRCARSLLDQPLARLDPLPDDLALARTPDLQGLGAPMRLPRAQSEP